MYLQRYVPIVFIRVKTYTDRLSQGGITSSDIATKAIGMRRALVLGQAAVGVPLWRSASGDVEKWPELPYIVFPGNVGQVETLGEVVASYRTMDER
jgi:uncharacterized protein YgbK (DUF1537 family)